MMLWMAWWEMVWQLRSAFSRERTFLWSAATLAGFCTEYIPTWSAVLHKSTYELRSESQVFDSNERTHFIAIHLKTNFQRV
jgi:hypothetical protein